MIQSITRKLLALILCCIISTVAFAQNEINSEFINRVNYVFSSLEKNRVPNGLLLDYAMEFEVLKLIRQPYKHDMFCKNKTLVFQLVSY